MFIDTHCHLNHEQFATDFESAVERANAAGVDRMIVVGFDLESSERAVELASLFPTIAAAAAIHPHDARQYSAASEKRIRELAAAEGTAALGEIGLDFHYEFSSREDQSRAFRAQLALAAELELPVIIHCREAYPDTLSVLEQGLNRSASGVMHCWAGAPDEARRAIDLGMYLGFGGVITFKNAESVREVLASSPIERILLETDAPYLAPVPYRGKRNEPAYIPLIASRVAEIVQRDTAEIARITTENARRLFARTLGRREGP